MNSVYLVCAIIGGAVFLMQLAMQLIGLDHDVDVDMDIDIDVDVDAGGDHGDSSLFFGFLSFRTMVAAVLFFGLTGLAGKEAALPPFTTGIVAVGAGIVAMIVVGAIMSALKKMQASGTLDIRYAVGQPGSVYLTIPGENGGSGKVSVTVQSRLRELLAVTPGNELPSGTKVVVTRVVTADTVEVTGATAEEV